MRSAVVLSFLSAVALGAPTPNPLRIGSESPGSEHKRSPANPNVDDSKSSIGLGIPAVVIDGHPIKIPHVKRDPADDVDDSKFSIGSHSIITGGPAVSIDGHAKGGSVGNDPGSSIHIHIRDPEPNLAKKRSAEIITGASAIGFGTSATGGSVSLSGDSKGKDGACKNGKHGKDGKDGKDGTEGAGIANGGNGGDALVPGSRAGNGGNGGIIINP